MPNAIYAVCRSHTTLVVVKACQTFMSRRGRLRVSRCLVFSANVGRLGVYRDVGCLQSNEQTSTAKQHAIASCNNCHQAQTATYAITVSSSML